MFPEDKGSDLNPYNGAHARTLPAPRQAANPAKHITISTTTKAQDYGPRATTTVKPRHPVPPTHALPSTTRHWSNPGEQLISKANIV